ncbi:MAG: type II toxin-antitoxin system MqsA family antitoxin [Ignavibacteriae bacterium]|nr:type II toxin-antitoxin system MqsA family antitoxin [Ignavibacteriota bacterium]
MNARCNFCGNKNFSSKRVEYLYKHDEKFLLVNNVPCEECDFCGERYYDASILKQIETLFFDIHVHGRKAKRETNLPIEDFVQD